MKMRMLRMRVCVEFRKRAPRVTDASAPLRVGVSSAVSLVNPFCAQRERGEQK